MQSYKQPSNTQLPTIVYLDENNEEQEVCCSSQNYSYTMEKIIAAGYSVLEVNYD